MHNNYAKTFKSLNYFYPEHKYKLLFYNYISPSDLITGKNRYIFYKS